MLDDLLPETQKELAEFMGYKSVEELKSEGNYDTFAIAEVYKSELEAHQK